MNRIVAVVGALAVLNGFAAERRLSMDEYRARMRAAWEGQYAIRGGWDTDCNASSACGVLCTALGPAAIDRRYLAKLRTDATFSHSPYTFAGLLAVSEKLARQVIVRFGGRIEKDAKGAETLVLPDVTPKPSACVSFARPGPVEGGRYTQDEVDKILYQPFCGKGLQMCRDSVPK